MATVPKGKKIITNGKTYRAGDEAPLLCSDKFLGIHTSEAKPGIPRKEKKQETK